LRSGRSRHVQASGPQHGIGRRRSFPRDGTWS